MNKIVIALFLFGFAACQTVKIKNETYKVSDNPIELGSIGNASSKLNLENSFEIKSLPILENKIRVNISIVPYTKKTAKAYQEKSQYQQNLSKLNYIDSLPVKPELVTIQIADKLGYVSELNAEYNKAVYTLLTDLQEIEVVSGVALHVSNENLTKIKQADAYYLINNQDKKYTIALYKQGKKVETLEIIQNAIIAYQTNVFCWAQTQRGKWYVADMATKSGACKGKTFSKVTELKKEVNLFKM